jgi:hypothetical protein
MTPEQLTPEIIEATAGLGQYGAIGVVILSLTAVVAVVYGTFRFTSSQSELNRRAIAEQSSLNRENHTENTKVMSGALREVTAVIGKFASDTRAEHAEMKGHNQTILHELREVKAKVKG